MKKSEKNLPEHYFCPKCNAKATEDLIAKLKGDGMPTLYIINMALNILSDARCPNELLQKVAGWARKYNDSSSGLTEEEEDKLKLLKWKRWANPEQK